MNKIKIIIIGFGSIGKRHYKNLLNLGYRNISVYDPVNNAFAGFKDVNRVKNLTKNKLIDYQVAFICNPNNQHIKAATLCAQAGCHLLIEKPLSHNLKGVVKLQKICAQKKLVNMVACNMRFHPCLEFIKNYLVKNKLGKIYSIAHELGYYLPFWRPQQDYQKNYAAKKSTGGGIILDDIHEFDLLFWLNNFIKVKQSKFIFNKAGDLKIATEDNCIASFEFSNKVLGLVKCDYLQKHYSRGCKIVGEKGNLEWDFNENVVWYKNENKKKKVFQIKNFDFNKVYIDEIKYFFNCVNKKQKTFNDIKIASVVLRSCVSKK